MTSLMSESAENLRHRAEEKAYLDENTPTQSLSPEETEHLLSNEEMKEVAFKLLWAEERERERMACVLREQVGQSLLMAKMKLEALAVHTSPDSFRKHVDEAAVLIETSIRDVLSLTSKIRPTILETFRIETALEWLCSSIGNEYSLLIDFTDDLRPKPLAEEVSYALYQAVRELLLNVVKHAGAEKAQLSLKTDNQQLVVQVNDNGAGFNTHDTHRKHSNKRGYGLYSVKQRMGFVGGSFAVESAPGKGTSVTLTVPLGEMKGVCE